jgi:hypothetical protein
MVELSCSVPSHLFHFPDVNTIFMMRARRPPPALLCKILLAAAFACMFGYAPAATAPAFSDDVRVQMQQALHRELARAFTLDKALALDPALRTSADKIAQEHLARMDKVLPGWLDEERVRQSGSGKPPSSQAVYFAVFARLMNELALWQLEPGDAHYENATLTALRTAPNVCDVTGDYYFTDFASRILRIQALPATEREAMLAGERQLLAHWGQPRANPAPWPDPLPQQAAYALLQQGPADAGHPRLALPPRLAFTVLGQGKDYAGLHPVERCALQQWWLQESLRQGVAPAAALNAFRYGTMLTASDRAGNAFDKPGADAGNDLAGPPPYPGIASRFGVTGVTTVSVRLDPAGKPLQAAVIGRKIDVPGIRGVRPVAYEDVFDAVIAKYAMQEGRTYGKPSGDVPYKFQMVWDLDGDKNPKAPKGAKK